MIEQINNATSESAYNEVETIINKLNEVVNELNFLIADVEELKEDFNEANSKTDAELLELLKEIP